MKTRTFWRMLRSGKGTLLARLVRMATPVYRASWLVAAARAGLLARLAAGARSFDQLASELAPDPVTHEALRAWLRVGEKLGEIASTPGGWRLRGTLARRFADPENDALLAISDEIVDLHHMLLLDTLPRLRRGDLFALSDQDGTVIARSSRLIEPVIFEVIDALVPAQGAVRLLEIGCGSGTYIRYAAERNARLEALGLELQPEVAQAARTNLQAWGVGARAHVEAGDVRERAPEPTFDVVTLHNNIYYFPVDERVALFEHLRGFLRPGGRLVVTTGCADGSVGMQLLDLWSAATRGCGRLPAPAELEEQMQRAGFEAVRSWSLIPGESYCAFAGQAPA